MSTTLAPPLPISAPFKRAVAAFFAYPFHFLALQIPELSVDWVQMAVGAEDTNRMALVFLVVMPYFCIATYLSRATTYASIVQVESGCPSMTHSFRIVLSRWKRLIPVSLLTGVLFLFGFAAFVLPAIYFLTIYLFVPALVVTEPPSPWSSYLYKSKRLVNTALSKTLGVVILMLAISAVLEFDVGRAWLQSCLPEFIPTFVIYGVKLAVMAFVGALCSLWISYYFESLRLSP